MSETPDNRVRWRSLVRATVTSSIVLSSGAVVFAGTKLLGNRTAAPVSATAPAVPVTALPVEMKRGYRVTRRFTGQVEGAARTDLGFEAGGRVVQVLADEGDRVSEGAILARLDTSGLIPERAALEAERAALAADAELARLTLARSDALTDRGFRSVAAQDEARLTLTRTEAGLAAIRARIAGIDVQLEKSELPAPFDAVVGTRSADPGQTMAAGQTVMVLFAAAPARLRVGLPPDLAAGLRPGDGAAVDLDGAISSATVRQLRPDLDPGTRSRSVVLTLAPEAVPVLGTTADLIVEQRIPEPGFWAPLSALREGVRGSWSVMAIETTPGGDRARPAAVEVIHSDGSRVFLRGALPRGARIVAEAPHRVAPGQSVLARTAGDETR